MQLTKQEKGVLEALIQELKEPVPDLRLIRLILEGFVKDE